MRVRLALVCALAGFVGSMTPSPAAAESLGWHLRNACANMPAVEKGETLSTDDFGYAHECLGYFEALIESQAYLNDHGRKPVFCYPPDVSAFASGVAFVNWINDQPVLLNGKAVNAALTFMAQRHPCR
jgi:hypothetical protein